MDTLIGLLFWLVLIGVPVAIYLAERKKLRVNETALLERRAAIVEYNRQKMAALDRCYREQQGLRVSRRFDSVDLSTSIAVDDAAGHVYLVDAHHHSQFYVTRFPVEGVIAAKLSEEGRTIRETRTDTGDQITRAAIGELIGGTSGAFAGAITARRISTSAKFCERIELHLTMDSLDRPLWKLVFSEGVIPKDSDEYQWRKEQAKQWEASMKVLIGRKRKAPASRNRSATVKAEEVALARQMPALPAEPSFHVSKNGEDLGSVPVSRIRHMIDRGDLVLDQDYYFDQTSGEWSPLIDLPS